jgi:hypothetical protein
MGTFLFTGEGRGEVEGRIEGQWGKREAEKGGRGGGWPVSDCWHGWCLDLWYVNGTDKNILIRSFVDSFVYWPVSRDRCLTLTDSAFLQRFLFTELNMGGILANKKNAHKLRYLRLFVNEKVKYRFRFSESFLSFKWKDSCCSLRIFKQHE